MRQPHLIETRSTHSPLPRGAFMNHAKPETKQSERPKLSEDWISVIVGIAIVIIVCLFNLTSIPWPLFGLFS